MSNTMRLIDKSQTQTTADHYFDKFCALVNKLMNPKYRPTEHDELNLAALQQKINELDDAAALEQIAATNDLHALRNLWPRLATPALQQAAIRRSEELKVN